MSTTQGTTTQGITQNQNNQSPSADDIKLCEEKIRSIIFKALGMRTGSRLSDKEKEEFNRCKEILKNTKDNSIRHWINILNRRIK